jgi:hypothetical protein
MEIKVTLNFRNSTSRLSGKKMSRENQCIRTGCGPSPVQRVSRANSAGVRRIDGEANRSPFQYLDPYLPTPTRLYGVMFN